MQDPIHPAQTQFFNAPNLKPVHAMPTASIPRNTPPFCMPDKEVDWPGVKENTIPA